MAWTTPETWANEVATAAKWTTELKTNQIALKDPPSDNYELNQGSNYSTTSATYTAIDAINLGLSITTTGGDVLVGFCGVLTPLNTGLVLELDLYVDGVGLSGGSGSCGSISSSTAIEVSIISFTRLVTGLAAGVHTFELQWLRSGGGGADSIRLYAGAGTASYDVHPQFWARELT